MAEFHDITAQMAAHYDDLVNRTRLAQEELRKALEASVSARKEKEKTESDLKTAANTLAAKKDEAEKRLSAALQRDEDSKDKMIEIERMRAALETRERSANAGIEKNKNHANELAKREEDLTAREQMLIEKENGLKEKEKVLAERRARLQAALS